MNKPLSIEILRAERVKRTAWFTAARFGMFIHWGIYAIPARNEWVRHHEKISDETYREFFHEFNPTRYSPRLWAKLAKAAGMKYAVMTAKHHDGFCLFDSKLTDFKATNTLARRDLIREFVEAFRAEGLAVGLYYSLLDWHHPDYPVDGDPFHPMREHEDYKNRNIDFSRYIMYCHGQIRELLSNYGKIDILWLDFSYEKMSGETWRATELVKMARSLQPNILIDNRLGGNIRSATPEIYAGDFASPEQLIPPEEIRDETGYPIPWELCIPMNNSWGYCASDQHWKSTSQIIRTLVECVSKNGNLLLNVGPDASGEIPEVSCRTLMEIGRWMDRNGASIYGCGPARLPRPDWGYYTQNGNKLYAHLLERRIGPIGFRSLNGKVKKARLLADGSELILRRPINAGEYPDDTFINFGPVDFYTYPLPDTIDTVVALELNPSSQEQESVVPGQAS